MYQIQCFPQNTPFPPAGLYTFPQSVEETLDWHLTWRRETSAIHYLKLVSDLMLLH